jgi:hypothetical protein
MVTRVHFFHVTVGNDYDPIIHLNETGGRAVDPERS